VTALHDPGAAPWAAWTVHPSVVVGLAVTGGLYAFLGGLRAPRRRIAAFAGSLAVLFLSLNGPLHNLSDEYLFSAHMVQHLLLTLLFPPLFLYGLPAEVVGRALYVVRRAWVMRALRWITRPVPAALVFLVPITAWHFPVLYEAAMRDHDLHIVQHLTFLSTSVLMWWPILSPVPELPRAPYPVQLVYLFLLGIPMSVVGALITLSQEVLYPFYAAAPRVWGLAPVADQQLGGLIMWVPGGLMFWVVMTVVWFRWSAHSERGEEGDRVVPAEVYR
jgi:putative membrane protein